MTTQEAIEALDRYPHIRGTYVGDAIYACQDAACRMLKLETALEACIMAHDLPGDHCEMEQAIDDACAILYADKAEGRKE